MTMSVRIEGGSQLLVEEKPAWVGKPVERIDAEEKITGRTKFFSDLNLAGMVWAKAVRSKHPHALIKKIDTSAAENYPGVVAVLIHKDVPGVNGHGIIVPHQPVLCWDKVRYLGDAVALVVAETTAAAEQAAEKIKVDYEPLPVVSDPIVAMAPDAPKIHEEGNIYRHERLRFGDVEAAFRNAAIVVEHTYQTGRQMHMYLETESGVAYIDDQDRLVIQAGGQSPYRDQMQICRALGLPAEKVRVIHAPVGGAFGAKEEINVQVYLGMAALKIRRPVKMVWSREESGVAAVKRHPMIVTMKTAASKDGKLLANQVRIISDTGAYASFGAPVLDVAIENAFGPYSISNFDIEGFVVYTNNGVSGAFRGFGAPQVNFALESQVDLIAEKLGIDKIAIRKLNALRPGGLTPFGHKVGKSTGIYETLLEVERHDLWVNRHQNKLGSSAPWRKRGVGVAAAIKGFSFGALPDFGAASIAITRDGRFLVSVSCPEIGQGNATAYAQIAAESLHCELERVTLISGDSAMSPDTGSSSASRSLYVGGNAIIKTAEKMMDILLAEAARLLNETEDMVDCQLGRIVSKRDRTKSVTYDKLAEEIHSKGLETKVVGGFNVPRADKPVEGSLEIPHTFFMYGSMLALIEVDTLTGVTKVLKIVLAPDSGRVIHPQNFTGQCEGAIIQGLGYALTEDTLIEDGIIKTNNFTTYIVPSVADSPEIEIIPVEIPEETGPFGAKGLAELPLVPVASAICNAIYDAVDARIFKIPATPERVKAALKESRDKNLS